jgi:hypothetical protein
MGLISGIGLDPTESAGLPNASRMALERALYQTRQELRRAEVRLKRMEDTFASIILDLKGVAQKNPTLRDNGTDLARQPNINFANFFSLTEDTVNNEIEVEVTRTRFNQNYVDEEYTVPTRVRWVACDSFTVDSGAALTLAADAVLCVI